MVRSDFIAMVAIGVVLAVLIIFVHPATAGPDAPLDTRMVGKSLRSLLASFVAAILILFLPSIMAMFRRESCGDLSTFPGTAARLALFCTHLC